MKRIIPFTLLSLVFLFGCAHKQAASLSCASEDAVCFWHSEARKTIDPVFNNAIQGPKEVMRAYLGKSEVHFGLSPLGEVKEVVAADGKSGSKYFAEKMASLKGQRLPTPPKEACTKTKKTTTCHMAWFFMLQE
jgi:hypothetical protein